MSFRSNVLHAVIFTSGVCLLISLLLATAPQAQEAPDGHKLFQENCAACHGEDGHGDRRASDLGFDIKMPNFHDCSYATREADGDWASTIHRGGHARAFPRQMPAWDKALNDDEIDAIIGYLRTFCAATSYPRGDFNLPLAMFTEKAFPEDEVLNQTQFNTRGAAGFSSVSTLEKRFGETGQLEVNLPINNAFDGSHMQTGIGDVSVAWKQNILADLEDGNIFSLLGEAVLPTGDERRDLGQGTFSFEPHALFGKMMGDYFLQGDIYGSLPADHLLSTEADAHFAFGRTFAEDDGWGRAWTPQIEFLAAHEFTPGAGLDMDIVPQMQVSVSQLQHVLVSVGERIPLNHWGPERQPQLVFYVIWDWYDGGLFEGWH